jgi:hypothetical protein
VGLRYPADGVLDGMVLDLNPAARRSAYHLHLVANGELYFIFVQRLKVMLSIQGLSTIAHSFGRRELWRVLLQRLSI